MNCSEAHSPPCKGGVAVPSRKKDPFRTGTAGVVAHKLRCRMRFETWCVSDHPVCAFKGGFAAFLDGAATPPQRGGECPFAYHLPAIECHFRQRIFRCVLGLKPGKTLLTSFAPMCVTRSSAQMSRK